MRRALLATLAALTVLAVAMPTAAQQADGPYVYAEDDAAMNAAIAEARATLPIFWRRAADAGTSRPLVKVAVPADDGANEYMWVAEARSTGAGYAGLLINQPRLIAGLAQGSTVSFTEAQIVDWAYESGGRLWGAYTQRVMLEQLDPASAARHRAYLSETPLEPKTD